MNAVTVAPRRYILVKPRNPEVISDGVDKVYRGEMKSSEKKMFSWDECVERYLKVYKGLKRYEL